MSHRVSELPRDIAGDPLQKYRWFLNVFLNGTWMFFRVLWPTVFEWYLNGFLNDIMNGILDSLHRLVVLNGILNYRWEYHWVLLIHHWYWLVFNGNQWYTIGSFLWVDITQEYKPSTRWSDQTTKQRFNYDRLQENSGDEKHTGTEKKQRSG